VKRIVVLTGAGISAESGLGTFRGSSGLWENYRIEDVATIQAFKKNPALVLKFYNIRRKELLEAFPNQAHVSLNKLQEKYSLSIITQNIDDLHERSGGKNILHLHGKLIESRSVIDGQVYPIEGPNLNIGDLCKKGGQLRPNVVWFGEPVPKMEYAINEVNQADIFLIIGTSLNVYPAASLLDYAKKAKRIIIIDPKSPLYNGVEVISQRATIAVPKLVEELLNI